MDLSYKNINLFPVPIHQFDVNGFSEIQDELIDHVYKMREKDPIGNIISNRHGWQSSCFSLDNQDDVLHNFLSNCLSKFPSIEKSVKLFAHAWININPTGAFNTKHSHPTSNLSGVLWIKCPENCGNIIFENPNSFAAHLEVACYNEDFRNNNYIFNTYWFPPIEGRILVFPSYLEHRVDFNKSNEDRISVSFNIRLQE